MTYNGAACGSIDPVTNLMAYSRPCSSFAACPPAPPSPPFVTLPPSPPTPPSPPPPPPASVVVRTESELVAALHNTQISTIRLGDDIALTTQQTFAAILPHVQRKLSIIGECGAVPCALDASAVPRSQYSRILRVDMAGDLTLVSVALRGAACGDGGCAIYVDNDSFARLYGCVVANNTHDPALTSYVTMSQSCTAGGVCSLPMADIRDTAFVNNSGVNGGALALMGGYTSSSTASYALIRLTFTGNTASQSGGAVYTQGLPYFTYMPNYSHYGAWLFESCSFSGNTAGTSGGAVASLGRFASCNSSFDRNTALTADGGAIWSNSAFALVASRFTNNSALSTSNYNYNPNNGGQATSSGRGGAVFSAAVDSSSIIGGCAFLNNTAGGTGGGVYYSPYVITLYSNFSPVYPQGGLMIRNSTFRRNSARDGGALFIEGGTRVILQATEFTANVATGLVMNSYGSTDGPGRSDFALEPSPGDRIVVDALTAVADPTTGPSFVNDAACLDFNAAVGYDASGAPSATGVPANSNWSLVSNQLPGACDYGREGFGLGCGSGGSQLSLSAVTITAVDAQVRIHHEILSMVLCGQLVASCGDTSPPPFSGDWYILYVVEY